MIGSGNFANHLKVASSQSCDSKENGGPGTVAQVILYRPARNVSLCSMDGLRGKDEPGGWSIIASDGTRSCKNEKSPDREGDFMVKTVSDKSVRRRGKDAEQN